MALLIVRLGSNKNIGEFRIGTVRRPPRGVKKEDYSKLNYYDSWLPELSPSAELMKLGNQALDEKSWANFRKKFLTEMKGTDKVHLLNFIVELSKRIDVSVGCYCENEARCHRSILKELLIERGAVIISDIA